MNCSKMDFADTINELDNTLYHPNMTACESYGITWGCDIDCPTLIDGKCELKNSENYELYQQLLKDNI